MIEACFKALKEKGEKALIPYIMAGDPNLETTLELLKRLPEYGADIIELGIPFTDPMADGPAIQKAARRALDNKTVLRDILGVVKQFRSTNQTTPLILMGYFNPIFAYGAKDFCRQASEAGVNGLLIVDIPPEEGRDLWPFAKECGLDIIRMITPTSRDERLHHILHETSGFLYYVSITGITGTASACAEDIGKHIDDIRDHTQLPIVVGFGIKTPQNAYDMGQIADGAVVGSVLVNDLHENGKESCLSLAQTLKQGLSGCAQKAKAG